jgi:DMSO/TMAO reductase YedYZ heme-binding membrane subunit
MTGRTNPVSIDLRRGLGFWCALFSLAHVTFGVNVHMASRKLYFVSERGGPRADLFGIGNYLGVVAALVLILLATSNDYSNAALGKSAMEKYSTTRLSFLLPRRIT